MAMRNHPHAAEVRPPSLAAQLQGLPLLDARPEGAGREPAFLVAPITCIEIEFQHFHARHPEVYRMLEEEALARVQRGQRRLAIARLVEELRYDPRFRPDPAAHPFKINNNYRALYARLLIHHHPSLAEVFALRDRREAAHGE